MTMYKKPQSRTYDSHVSTEQMTVWAIVALTLVLLTIVLGG